MVDRVIEVVERGPQGIAGQGTAKGGTAGQVLTKRSSADFDTQWSDLGEIGAVTDWNTTRVYSTDDKVAYGANIYNALSDNIPAGTLPTDTIYWEDITGGASWVTENAQDGDIITYNQITDEWKNTTNQALSDTKVIRGGDAPNEYNDNINYMIDSRTAFNKKEYRCIAPTTGTFNPNDWYEVNVQRNEERIALLENEQTGTVINEYAFTQTTQSVWAVSNAGVTQTDFDSALIEFFYDGVKLRKGKDVVWVSDNVVRIPLTSVIDENFLNIRVTSTTSIAKEPKENIFTQSVASGGVWSVSGIGDTADDFASARIQVYYNGVKLRKGAQVIWVSPIQLLISYTSVSSEDYLTIRNDP